MKIQNFLAMTETGNEEEAMKYLEEANWDETKAVNNFFNKSTPIMKPINTNLINDLNYSQNSENNMISSDNNRLNSNLINQNSNNINNNNINNNDLTIKRVKKENIISKFLSGTLNFLLDCCSERREVTKTEEKKIFEYLPNINDDFFKFCQSLKRKIGILILYTKRTVPFLNNLISQICRSTINFNILKQDFIIYPLLASTNEGNRIQGIVSDNELVFPSFVFCHNSSKYPSALLIKSHVLTILESENINLKIFHSTLLDILKKCNLKRNNINDINNNISNEFDKSFGPLTDAEILNQQNYEMAKLENEAIKKEEELKKEKINEEKRKKEEENKIKEIENKAKEAKVKVVEEPEEDNPDTAIICFRYPDGEKTKNRRFLKNHTIQNLYDYITSLGAEIYTEKENNNFSLYQPFPPKKFDIMENTLEKEGLFPNAVIQIREE
jgi:hypothetical protein